MHATEYQFIRDLVYQHSRINLGPDKRELVSARLAKRLRAMQVPSVGDYCALLRSPEGEDELGNLIDAISTNHTYFFREEGHFDALKQVILPELVRRREQERWPQLRVWSAACSSGEEPYSVAIFLSEYFKSAPGWPWQVEATDISRRVLTRAAQGVYPSDAVSRIDPRWVKTYFNVGYGPQDGNYRVRATVRDRVRFSHLNLLEGTPPFPQPFHIIFCRNVMIYFDRPTQQELVNRLRRLLVPGGFLMVGHSESLTNIEHDLKMIRPATYRAPSA
ncbi:MAG TPA: protein-glutamate O-methyltransferase [Candidatus Synoicihabitans sp.]|nr:protein-glutamate O-methyltransferase [Candidatus Synoicihabitans sp.]